MKKIYLLGLASMFALAVNAQTTLKVKNPLKKNTTFASDTKLVKGKKSSTSKNVGTNSTQAVVATITCNTPYVAGTTMDLNMSYQSSNTDLEYVDYLEITFPAGITPTGAGNTSNPFPNTADAGGGLEALNGAVGQVVSWGANNDDQYGGIFAPTAIAFVVEVTIAGGTTGAQTASFTASGDGYGASPADQGATTFTIQEQQASNLSVLQANLLDAGSNFIQNGCGLTSGNLVVFVKNNGATDITVGNPADEITYTVNGTPTTVPASSIGVTAIVDLAGNPLTTIVSGDTAAIIVLGAIDLSTAGTTYLVDASINFAGSGDGISTDNTATQISITHFAPFDVTAAPYTMGFETPADDALFASWTFPATNIATWQPFNQYYHSGSMTLVKFGTASDDDWAISGCIDMVGGNQYDLSYWLKYYDIAVAPDVSVYYGSSPDAAGMTNLISNNALAADTMYHQWNASITPATTGTYYIGFHAFSAAGSSAIMIDDINLAYNPVSIKETIASNIVSIFPNPNAGVFTVKATENNSSVAVYSIIGENVYSSKLAKGNNSIDLTNLAAGSYIVKVNNGGTLVTKRVVINK